jgi:hypothetical protein
VTADPDSINAALKEFANSFSDKFSAVVQDGASANAWPMATYSYLLIHTTYALCSLFRPLYARSLKHHATTVQEHDRVWKGHFSARLHHMVANQQQTD